MSSRSTKTKRKLKTTLGKAPSDKDNSKDGDISNLWKPIETSIFGLRHALTLFETATDEVRRLLLYECDLIYECRICRNLYRSLANFVLHKRNYCCDRYKNNPRSDFFKESTDYIISYDTEEEEETQPADKRKISSVLERLNKKREAALLSEEVINSDEKENEEVQGSEENEESDKNIKLERIKSSKSAVFQTVTRNLRSASKEGGIKDEVMEIHSIFDKNEAVLGRDGKVVILSPKENDLICSICKQKFLTKKTLSSHIKIKHNVSKLVFPCPACKEVFASSWSVFRHLFKVHRKTAAQVRRLRNQVQAKAYHKNQHHEEQKKSLSTPADEENEWMENFEGDNDLQMCGGCGKRFERKAALHSHSALCSKRIAICNTLSVNRSKRSGDDSSSKIEERIEKTSKPYKATLPTEKANMEVCRTRGSARRKPNILRRRVSPQKNPPKEQETQEEAKQENTTPIVVSDDEGEGDGQKKEDTVSAEETQGIEEEVPQESAAFEKEKGEAEVRESASPEVSIVLPEDSITLPPENSVLPLETVPNPVENSTSEADKSSAAPLKQEDLYKIIGIAMSSDDSPVEETVPSREAVTVEDPDVVYVHDSTTEEEVEEEEEEEELQALFEEDDEESEKPDVEPLGSDILDAAIDSSTSSEAVEETPMDTIVIDENGVIFGDDTSSSSSSRDCRRKRKRSSDPATPPPLPPFKRRYSSVDLATDDSNFSHAESLDQRMSSYVSVEHLTCNHCELKFPEMEALRAHMALHFNWYRYQCDLCSFKCYQKGPTFTHVINKHKIRTVEQIEAAIFDIPEWKSARYCSRTFVEILAQSPREDYDEPPAFLAVDMKGEEEGAENFLADVKEQYEQVEMFPAGAEDEDSSLDLKLSGSSCEALPALPELKLEIAEKEREEEEEEKKDPEMFKMVMEVIFGSAPQSNATAAPVVKEEAASSPEPMDSPSKESSTSPADPHPGPKSRPIRQRTPFVHKDFLYDMSSLVKGKVSTSNTLSDARGVNKVTSRRSAPKFCSKINRDVENKVQYPVVPKLRLRKCEEIYVRCEEKMDDSNS